MIRRRLFTTAAVALLIVLLAGPSAAFVWTRTFKSDTGEGQQAAALAIDSHGSVVATGWVDAVNASGISDHTDFFIAKVDGLDGHTEWTRTLPGTINVGTGFSVAVDGNDDAVAVGALFVGPTTEVAWTAV